MQSIATSGTEGIGETFFKMVKNEGLFRPVRGMSAVVVGAGPSHALYFSSYEFLKNSFTQYTKTEKYHTLVWGKYITMKFSFIILKYRFLKCIHNLTLSLNQF